MKLQIIVLFFVVFRFNAQQNYQVSDSLNDTSIKDLYNLFFANIEDEQKANIYAVTMLEKARIVNDTLSIYNGFSFLAYLNQDNELAVSYSDSIIKIARKSDNNEFLGVGYLNKADYYYRQKEIKKALDNYLNAKKHVENYARLNYITDHSIGTIKSRLGEDKEALEIFKKSWKYVNDENFKEEDNDNYLITLISLANSYNRVKKYDSAAFFNILGIKESRLVSDSNKYFQFLLSDGINTYDTGYYEVAHNTLYKVVRNLDASTNAVPLISAHYYLGKTCLKINKIDSAITCFKRVDSLFQSTKDMEFRARESYEYIINYYKQKDDTKNQLKYIGKLLEVDSILNDNYRYLSKRITKEYDTPILLKEKENIIQKLEGKNTLASNKLLILSVLLVLTFLGLIYYYIRQIRLKKRFDRLKSTQVLKGVRKKYDQIQPIGMPEEVANSILDNLDQFEAEDGFLDANITIHNLSKQFGTNAKYLSKIINTYKNKNFSHYINDHRVDFVIEKLKLDKKFRKYTIKAISGEIGFNTTQAFSKAFYKRTKIHPSYFIKTLEKEEKE